MKTVMYVVMVLAVVAFCVLVVFLSAVLLTGAVLFVFYHQIGPTCGFYALVYGTAKIKLTRNKKRMVREIIINSIENKCSCMGEIFNIDTLFKIAKTNFPTAKIKLADAKSTDDLDEYLTHNYIIFPSLEKDKSKFPIPHYYFLEKSFGEKYVYRGALFLLKKTQKKEKLYKTYENLKKEKEFNWNEYFKYKDKKILGNFVSRIIWFISDCKLNRYLKQAEIRVREEVHDKTTSVDMYGRVLLINKMSLLD